MQNSCRCEPGCEPEQEKRVVLDPVEKTYLAVKHGDLFQLETLVKDHGRDLLLMKRDEQGHTLVHWAAYIGSVEILEFLKVNGCALNEPSNDQVQLHPIHWACTRGHLAALHFFVTSNVSINTADQLRYRTPALLASQYGFPLLVLYCVKNGAHLDIVDIDGDSAVHWAAYQGSTETIALLQYLGLNTNAPDAFGQTPLHLAALQGNLDTVQYLVEELDADITALDEKERTPADLAEIKKRGRVVQYLKERDTQTQWLNWVCPSGDTSFRFVLFNIPIVGAWYYFLFLPHIPDEISLFAIHFVINVCTWGCFAKASKTQPGFCVLESKEYQIEYEDALEAVGNEGKLTVGSTDNVVSVNRPLCHTCHIQRPLRAKHCRMCKHCVSEFDHHCPFINNCVGKNNYASFFGFVTFILINCIIMDIVLWKTWKRMDRLSLLFIVGLLYYTIVILMLSNLWGLHLYLTAKNITTNEMMNARRYRYLTDGRSPFDRGILQNCFTRIFPSFRHSSQPDMDDQVV